MRPRLVLALALPLLLAACATGPVAPPGQDITLRIDGRPAPIRTMAEFAAAGVTLPPAEAGAVQSRLGENEDGRSGITLRGSTDGSVWDYALDLTVIWNAPIGGSPDANDRTARLLADTDRTARLRHLDIGPDGRVREFLSSPGAVRVTLDRLAPEGGGIRAAGSFSGVVCTDDGTRCREMQGRFDTLLVDRTGTSRAPPILI